MRRPVLIAISVVALGGLVAGGIAAMGGGARPGPGAAVRVVDGDTLALDGQRIRLFGIDAPERAQSCARVDGRAYDCGRASAEALARLIGAARPHCREHYRDPYGRSVATCSAGGRELNRAMVAAGWAVAYTRYSRDYLVEEAAARRARRGLWQGRFERPEAYRAGQRRG